MKNDQTGVVAASFFEDDPDNVSIASDDHDDGLETSSTSRDNSGSDPADAASKETVEVIPAVKKENLIVNQAELLAFYTLLYAATSIGVAIRLLTKYDEEEEFETGFQSYAEELFQLSERRVEEALSSLLLIGDAMVASAANQQEQQGDDATSSFPTVTVPYFEEICHQALSRTPLSIIRWNPLVKEEDLEAWTAYVASSSSSSSTTPIASASKLEVVSLAHDNITSYFLPTWQHAPANGLVGGANASQNLLSMPYYKKIIQDLEILQFPEVSSPTTNLTSFLDVRIGVPTSLLVAPVYADWGRADDEGITTKEVVGYLDGTIDWELLFASKLSEGLGALIVELEDKCGSHHAFQVEGPSSQYLGVGEHFEPDFDKVTFVGSFDLRTNLQELDAKTPTACIPTMTVYATSALRDQYKSGDSALYTSIVLGVFFLTTLIFILYFCLVRRRHARLETTVEKTAKIVTNIFPGDAGKRILAEAQKETDFHRSFAPKAELKKILGSDAQGHQKQKKRDGPFSFIKDKPIADLFTETTVMFADIVGFTAWSSMREPSQVFSLLETIYSHFDGFANRRRVFKVETVGDCYVAVCGLPEARKDHALVMARFAHDCLHKFNILTKRMEIEFGPDTGDLGLRIGMHSGPVTAGVLRGERARFQLFGDTMNTTARMESTGRRNRIQISQETANAINAGGKSHWCVPREDFVFAKGKGKLSTFWLNVGTEGGLSSSSNSSNKSNSISQFNDESEYDGYVKPTSKETLPKDAEEKRERLVDWNTDLLFTQLRKIVLQRKALDVPPDSSDKICLLEMEQRSQHGSMLEEVQEIIRLPRFEARKKNVASDTVKIDKTVRSQLREYVQTLSTMYRDNSFHNFEHASHVTMSVDKLFSRIVAPDITHDDRKTDMNSILHDHTYGISSDPLTRFSIYLSALIHDVDHPGVPNAQLCKESDSMAKSYAFKSVAEQNSIDLAWNLLLTSNFKKLRQTIYSTEAEYCRFRKLVVNTVMATDIVDKELKGLRNARWTRAFDETVQENVTDAVNRKATIVMEHLIQASDVSHTMQHWHVYRKWNERFFRECYQAYLDGRAETDPSINWYKGELGFFDFYIIPLAKKLKECGVFGVSSDEYLNYAEQNRAEWERKGQEIVAEMVQEHVKDMKPSFKARTEQALSAGTAEMEELGRSISSRRLL